MSSDDRIKHNEEDTIGALSTMRRLAPRKYQKTKEMHTANFHGKVDGEWTWEAGLVAQEVMQIPELAFCVQEGDVVTDENGDEKQMPFGLNYMNIFVYGLAAIKELDAQVQSQQHAIAQLEAKLDLLEVEIKR